MKRSSTCLAYGALLLFSVWQAHANPASASAQAATFTIYPKDQPPAAVQRMLAGSSNAATDISGYRATILGLEATPTEFISGPALVNTFHGHRVSIGYAAPGPWQATSHGVSSSFVPEGFVDGSFPLTAGSSPGMSYVLRFEELPGLPGYIGEAVYMAETGSLDLHWDPDNDSSAGQFQFTTEITPTPASWGAGPDKSYTLQFEGEFIN